MADPIGEISGLREQPSGIRVGRMRVPIGVFAMIYESRPNVTIEAASLAIKSGNACILRGGSEALQSNLALAALVQARARRGRPAARRGAARRDHRPRRGRLPDRRARVGRPRHPARRQGADRAHRARGQGAGAQAPRRQLPRLRRRRRRPRHGAGDRRQRQDAEAAARATPPSRCSCTPAVAARSCRAIGAVFAPRASRCAATPRRWPCCGAVPGAQRRRRQPRPTGARSTWRAIISIKVVDSLDEAIAPHRPLRLAPHRRDRHRLARATRCASCARSIRRA